MVKLVFRQGFFIEELLPERHPFAMFPVIPNVSISFASGDVRLGVQTHTYILKFAMTGCLGTN